MKLLKKKKGIAGGYARIYFIRLKSAFEITLVNEVGDGNIHMICKPKCFYFMI